MVDDWQIDGQLMLNEWSIDASLRMIMDHQPWSSMLRRIKSFFGGLTILGHDEWSKMILGWARHGPLLLSRSPIHQGSALEALAGRVFCHLNDHDAATSASVVTGGATITIFSPVGGEHFLLETDPVMGKSLKFPRRNGEVSKRSKLLPRQNQPFETLCFIYISKQFCFFTSQKKTFWWFAALSDVQLARSI